MKLICWDEFGSTLEKQHLLNKVFLIKFFHDLLYTGSQQQKFKKASIAPCPMCMDDNETWRHMYKHTHNLSRDAKTLALSQFDEVLYTKNTAPSIQQVLTYKLTQWCNCTEQTVPIIPNDPTGELIQAAVEEWAMIDWGNFLKGQLSCKWKLVQQKYMTTCCPDMNDNSTYWID
eukprot:9619993-Ditylum_brightwellii.AAC.1